MPPFLLAEEPFLVRPMNINVADRAVLITRLCQVVSGRCLRSQSRAVAGEFGRVRVTLDAQEAHQISRQQFRIGRTVRRVAGLAAFNLDRRVFKHERALFVGVTFDAGRIAVDRIAQGFAHKAAVLVVAVGAVDIAFRHFVVERPGK